MADALFKRTEMLFTGILVIIVALALPSFKKGFNPVLLTRISSIIFIYAGALAFNVYYIQSIGSGVGIYSGLFNVSTISQLLDTVILFIASLILISWPLIQTRATENDNLNKVNYAKEYSLVVLFSTLGSILLLSSSDLISMYLSIELQSFGVYILASLFRYSESATSAGLKYFLLGGLSSCIILLGSGLIYAYTGLTNFENIYSLISVYSNVSSAGNVIIGLTLGIILIIIGFLFKVSAAPLHNWSPDVYDESPTIVTIWLTIMPKIAILIFLLEIITHSSNSLSLIGDFNILEISNSITNYSIKTLLLISSLLSLIIGSVVGLSQKKIKRLLAYSTISHIGFILLALLINSESSIESLLFYIIQYSLTNLNIFLIIIALGYIINNNIQNTRNNTLGKDLSYLVELKGQFYSNPLLSISLSICLFSMAGIPPLMGFFSKQFVLSSALDNGYYFMSIIAILTSVISASYYLKIVRLLHSELENNLTEGQIELSELNTNNSVITSFHSFLISSLTLIILLFVLKPSLILNSTQLLSLSVYFN
jgi:NADH-ubiquinone oxidoreductase chain 2